MLLTVFRQFISISLIRYIIGDLIRATDNAIKWKDASVKYGTQFVGPELFGNCQPETCNALDAANKIQKLGRGRQQFWINGYVLRSPLMVYKGCYSVQKDVENIYEENYTFSDNSPYICSRKCSTMTSGDLIFLNDFKCLCIREERFIAVSSMQSCVQVSNVQCDTVCPGNKSDICGGKKKKYNTNLTYFSAYEIIQRDFHRLPFRHNIGKACNAITLDGENNPIQSFQLCRKNLKYICEHYNATAMVYETPVCQTATASWSSARSQCQMDEQQLLSSDNNNCLSNGEQYWHGGYSEERIFWKNDTLPPDARCLLLEIDENDYSFAVEPCNNSRYALCSQQVPDVATTTPFDTFETTSSIATNLTKGSSSDGHANTTIVPIVAGVVGGVVVVAIIIAVLLIRKRRSKPTSKSKPTTITNRADYYSEPSITRYPPDEHIKLVNTTEEGVYNHLGDEENVVKLSPTGVIYHIMRHTENDYDISQTSRNQQEEQMNDLYDESRDIDRGLYDTTNEKTSNNRPESDAYTVLSVT